MTNKSNGEGIHPEKFRGMGFSRGAMKRFRVFLIPILFAGLVLTTFPVLFGRAFAQRVQPDGGESNAPALQGAKKAVVALEIIGKTPRGSFPYYPFLGSLISVRGGAADRLLAARAGSGVLIDANGHVLTNAFFVEGAAKVRAWLPGRGWARATVLGSDPGTDLSLLEVSGPPPFPFIRGGDSDEVVIGRRVFALGRDETRKITVAEGIISAKHHRNVLDPVSYGDFLQTDARIGPENSGGPLVNVRGEIVGVNDALLTRCSRLRGIGFAIPWNTASYVTRQLLKHGRVERAWLGLQVQDIIFRVHGARGGTVEGAMAIEVVKGSPAQKAGIQPGDVIVSFNGKAVQNTVSLVRFVSDTPVGGRVTLGILRNGVRKEVSVKVAARPEGRVVSLLEKRLGIAVVPAPVLRAQAKREKKGLVITWLDPNGPMERAGFERDDIIVEANGFPIRNQADLERVLRGLKPGGHILFLAIDHRTDRAAYVQVSAR